MKNSYSLWSALKMEAASSLKCPYISVDKAFMSHKTEHLSTALKKVQTTPFVYSYLRCRSLTNSHSLPLSLSLSHSHTHTHTHTHINTHTRSIRAYSVFLCYFTPAILYVDYMLNGPDGEVAASMRRTAGYG